MGCCSRRIRAAAAPPPAPRQVEVQAAKEQIKKLSAGELRKLGSVKTR